jgi:hypothetical protein
VLPFPFQGFDSVRQQHVRHGVHAGLDSLPGSIADGADVVFGHELILKTSYCRQYLGWMQAILGGWTGTVVDRQRTMLLLLLLMLMLMLMVIVVQELVDLLVSSLDLVRQCQELGKVLVQKHELQVVLGTIASALWCFLGLIERGSKRRRNGMVVAVVSLHDGGMLFSQKLLAVEGGASVVVRMMRMMVRCALPPCLESKNKYVTVHDKTTTLRYIFVARCILESCTESRYCGPPSARNPSRSWSSPRACGYEGDRFSSVPTRSSVVTAWSPRCAIDRFSNEQNVRYGVRVEYLHCSVAELQSCHLTRS